MQETSAADQALLDRIRQGDEKAFEMVYKMNRPAILRYVLQNHGTAQDAKDLYQNVMVAFHGNVADGKLVSLSGKLSTYLFKLAQNQWRNHLRGQKREMLVDYIADNDLPPGEPETDTLREDKFLQRLIDRLDERCQRILQLFYYERLSMQEVAQRVGLTDGESAKKRKYDCLNKLKKLADRYNTDEYEPE
ncbi:hypothetical protein GCM10023187_51260 [Nibrella viscosa]|uniref:RNA polymerase sigma-70 factor, ECF subfamily n=1 Tax=Nibrella viscosa TaxID=1084524 RepID=A0ABP8KY67_9BACT